MTMLITLDHTINAAPGHVATQIDRELILLDTQEGRYFELNEVGSRIWTLIQTPVSVKEVLHTLLEEYDVEQSHCEADLRSLLSALRDKGLVQVSLEEAI